VTNRAPCTSRRLLARLVLGLVIGGPTLSCSDETDAPWPQWRGPGGSGVFDQGSLPATWDGGLGTNVRWKAKVPGEGNSSPVVANDQVYLTASYPVDAANPEGDHHRVVLAYDLTSGELLWQREVFAAAPEKRHRLNTLAGPTPTTDGRSVYAYFGSTLARLDAGGEIVWSQVIDPAYHDFTRYGAASSAVLDGDLVLVAQDKEWAQTDDVGWLAAFDSVSGEQRWRTEWTETCCSYSTPVIVQRGAGREALFAHSGAIAGYDVATGERLWLYEYPMLQMVSTPVLGSGDLVGILGGADNRRGNLMLRLSGTGRETQVQQLWHDERLAPQVSSPVLYQGLLYSLTLLGVLVARDPESGDIVWEHRLAHGRNHASLMAGDGKVFATSTKGTVSVVAAGAELELLGENELGEMGTGASPAAGGGCLLLRGEQHLFCIEAAAP
jgi:outer membrane protein assembly factor BamB